MEGEGESPPARDRIFSFDVPPSARPGDVCKVNLPGGVCVEVTLPDGCEPGSSIEFSAPVPEPDSPRASTDMASASSPDAPILARLYWEGNPTRSQTAERQGLSNAAVE